MNEGEVYTTKRKKKKKDELAKLGELPGLGLGYGVPGAWRPIEG